MKLGVENQTVFLKKANHFKHTLIMEFENDQLLFKIDTAKPEGGEWMIAGLEIDSGK